MANKFFKPPAKISVDLNNITKQAAKSAQAANQAGRAAKIRRLSPKQMANMSPEQIQAYYKAERQNRRSDMRSLKTSQRQARKTLKTGQASELAIHQTIRQGLAELGGIGAEGVGSYAITKGQASDNAVTQNVSGGVVDRTGDDQEETSGNGPLARGKYGRSEE